MQAPTLLLCLYCLFAALLIWTSVSLFFLLLFYCFVCFYICLLVDVSSSLHPPCHVLIHSVTLTASLSQMLFTVSSCCWCAVGLSRPPLNSGRVVATTTKRIYSFRTFSKANALLTRPPLPPPQEIAPLCQYKSAIFVLLSPVTSQLLSFSCCSVHLLLHTLRSLSLHWTFRPTVQAQLGFCSIGCRQIFDFFFTCCKLKCVGFENSDASWCPPNTYPTHSQHIDCTNFLIFLQTQTHAIRIVWKML